MNNFFRLNDDERKTVILQTGIKMGNLLPQVVAEELR
jgi:AMMECR1 domain-containing protein